MDGERVAANWLVYAPQAQARWDRLSDIDLEEIGGNRDKLIIYLEDIYGYGKQRAETDADDWYDGLADGATLVTTKIDRA